MRRVALAVAALFVSASLAYAEDIRAVIEKSNEQWLNAFNTPNTAAFPDQYTEDAVLIPQEIMEPVKGPQAIKEYWEGGIKAGFKNHTFQVLDAKESGNFAYQLASWTLDFVKDGKTTPIAGHTMRIYEKQSDGSWKTKLHMYRYPPAPTDKKAQN
jgi:ketosteroid isomerase-like protein